MSWFTTKAVGDLGEKRLCRWFASCGLDALRVEGPADFDLVVQASIEVKHDLRAAATGHAAFDISPGARSGVMTSRATYWAHIVGDETILVRTEVLRQALVHGPWRVYEAGQGRRRLALVPVEALKRMEGVQVVGNQEVRSQKSGVRSQKGEARFRPSVF